MQQAWSVTEQYIFDLDGYLAGYFCMKIDFKLFDSV